MALDSIYFTKLGMITVCQIFQSQIAFMNRTDGKHVPVGIVLKEEQRKEMKPKIIVLCGSSRFCDVMAVCAWILEKEEKAITMGLHLLPDWYTDVASHLAEYESVADEMDELHLRKIDIADEIFVVNYEDYIGESTTKEIHYARERAKTIRWFTHDPIGEYVRVLIDKKIEEGRI